MKVLIIEDEKPASNKLIRLLNNMEVSLEILETLTSVEDSINWLNNHPAPDLIFMDVQLEDGICFDIFESIEIQSPVIFTTAYDHYAIRAFKVNSVDYLLKPIDQKELKQAVDKYLSMHSRTESQLSLESVLKMFPGKRKERFLIKIGEHFKSIPVTDIDCFFIEERCTFIHSRIGKTYALDYSLEKIEELVDPDRFFRINRNFIVNYSAIIDVVAYSSSRLKIKLSGLSEYHLLLVSRERVNSFKEWMDR